MMQEDNIESLKMMLESDSFSLRKAVVVLRALGCDVSAFEQWAEKPFAPREIEQRAFDLCTNYYKNVAKTVVSPQNTEGVKVEEKTDDPVIIVKLRHEQRLLRDERRALHMTLEDTEDLKLRGEKVAKIRQLTERIDVIFSQLDVYDETGAVPAVASAVDEKQAVLEVVDLFHKKKYLPERISRLKGWLKETNLGVHKKERHLNELRIKEDELKSVLLKLETINVAQNAP